MENALLTRARDQDPLAVAELFKYHEQRLRLMVRARMNPRLRRRLDEEDVIQDAFLEASQRLADYLQNPQTPFFLWLRQIVHRRILKVHRQHLGLQLRDVRREAPVRWATTSTASSCFMAEQLLGRLTSPSGAAIRQETRLQLEKVLEGMSEVDREILSLRYFEHLTNEEAAAELGLEASTASKRHVRALLRLEKALADLGLGANVLQEA
jgi:RNA polymerase sigma-70 factor (ECF subfamily)